MSKEKPNDERKVSDVINDKQKAPRRAEFAGFLKNAANEGYESRVLKQLNESRLQLCKQLEQEIAKNMEAVRMIESLKIAMKIHAGDICSANNEAEQFISNNQDLEEANECLVTMIGRALKVIAEDGSIDGSHHKQWVLDQVVHFLTGTGENYQKWITAHNTGPEGPNSYSWDIGIVP